MWLKAAIVILFIALLISLGSGLLFLFKDQGDAESKRTMHSLGVRITLAVALLALVTYGVLTGQLRSQAPWAQPPAQAQPDSNQ